MKGVVFTEFIEFVENETSIDTAESMIQQADLSTGGVFTSVGTYDHAELLSLVTQLSQLTGLPAPALVQGFGRHLFQRLITPYPFLLEGINDSFSFLEQVDGYIHVEVRKLYPDAELPTFQTERLSENQLAMIYRSSRPFADLAEGLILGCGDWFHETLSVTQSQLSGESPATRLTVTRHN